MRTTATLISVLLVALTSCSRIPTALEQQENALDISSDTERQFHSMLYFPKGEALHYSGYILAFEKSPKAIIDNPASTELINPDAPYLNQETDNGHGLRTKDIITGFQRIDRKSLFVSHIIKYDKPPLDNNVATLIDQCFIYNAFETSITPSTEKSSTLRSTDFHGMIWHHCPLLPPRITVASNEGIVGSTIKPEIVSEVDGSDISAANIDITDWQYQSPGPVHDLYHGGLSAMKKLECGLSAHIHEGGYTHLIVLVMGWNTSQDEAIRNFNDIVGNIIEAKNEDLDLTTGKPAHFKPLVLGVTWPSYWSRSFTNLFSYANKADDADELGLLWLNVLINRTIPVVLSQAAQKPNVVLIGHSFGARAAMRALFSSPLLEPPPAVSDKPVSEVDLAVGLQGAVSINRFVVERSHEGAPYRDFAKMKNTQIVLTASRSDKATALPFWYEPSGSWHTWQKICDSQSDELKNIFDCRYTESAAKARKATNLQASSNSSRLTGMQPDLFRVCSGSGSSETCDFGTPTNQTQRKVLYVDASDTVTMFNSPGSGGGAHSDIYRLPMGRLLWQLIKNYASGVHAGEPHAEIEYNKTMRDCQKSGIATASE